MNRTNLQVRYPDATEMWRQALDNNGLVLRFATQTQVTAAHFRLQMFRKKFRDTLAPTEASVYDRFKVRVPPNQAMIIIEPIPQFAPLAIETLDGEPIDQDQPGSGPGLNLETDE